MAQKSDQDLQDIKARALAAMGNGSHLARAEEYLVDLVNELLAQRKGASAGLVLKVGEMSVTKAPEPVIEPTVAPEPVVEPAPVAESSFEEVRTALEEASPVAEETKPKKKR